jgi:CRP-like cAMP-binding protein
MVDFQRLKSLYKLGKTLQFSDVQQFVSTAQVKTYAPKEYLIREGDTRKRVFLIQRGLVRVFALMETGVEKTMSLKAEHHILASPDLYLFDQPSRFYFQALEKTRVLCMDDEVIRRIVENNEGLTEHRKQIHLTMLKEAHQRIESFVLYSPEERYIRYVKENPDIVNRAPDKYIANVLGITPVSLSRIRKRITQRK